MNNTPKKENAAIELFSGFGNSDFRMKIGGTVYEVSTHFDPEGSRCVLQQFRDLILSEELLENRIIGGKWQRHSKIIVPLQCPVVGKEI